MYFYALIMEYNIIIWMKKKKKMVNTTYLTLTYRLRTFSSLSACFFLHLFRMNETQIINNERIRVEARKIQKSMGERLVQCEECIAKEWSSIYRISNVMFEIVRVCSSFRLLFSIYCVGYETCTQIDIGNCFLRQHLLPSPRQILCSHTHTSHT